MCSAVTTARVQCGTFVKKYNEQEDDEDDLNDHGRSIPVRELAGARRRDVRKDDAPNVSNVWNRKKWFAKDPRTDRIYSRQFE